MALRSQRRRALIATALWWVVVFDLAFATLVAAPFVAEAYEESPGLRSFLGEERYAEQQALWTARGLRMAATGFGVLIVPGVLLAGALLLQRRLGRVDRDEELAALRRALREANPAGSLPVDELEAAARRRLGLDDRR